MLHKRFYRFGEFVLDATAKVLLRDGRPVRLALKSVETLLVLVENAGQAVTKDEIMRAVWSDRVVDEANLMQNIAVIRRALAAAPGSPARIETFPGRGYRLVGPVTVETQAAPRPLRPRHRGWLIAALVAALLLPLGWFAAQRGMRSSAQVPRLSPVTRLPGREYQPAVSPDGNRVAFLWSREGKPAGVWVQAAESGSAPRALTRREGHFSSPAWAPDGKSLAYLRVERSATEILLCSVDSGEERLLVRLVPGDYGFDHRMLDWSPDGQSLAVAHSDAPGRPLGLSVVSVATGARRNLTQPVNVVGGDFEPRFSPDGKRISFIRYLNRSHQKAFTVPAGGGEPRQLTADGRQISSQDWMADGRTLVVASDRGGEFRLWKIRADASNPARTLAATGIYAEFPIQLSVARGAPAVVYSVLHRDRDIWRLDLLNKKWTRVVASSGQDASPQYSPSGDRICFRSDRSGSDQLWVSAADGSNPVQVTRGRVEPSVGRWSPAGRSIVFNDPKTREVFVASLGGDGAWSARSLGVEGVHPVFSSDGAWIYAGGMSSLVRIPLQGGAVQAIAQTRGVSVALSPDGAFLYFVKDSNDTVLWRLPVAGGEPARVLDGLVPGCTSCWALAPNGIYYLGLNPRSLDAQTLYFHELPAGVERVVLEYPEPLSPIGSGPFSLSPDGRRLLTVRVEPSNSDLTRVSNW
ncbi:MAG: PD40 domain-containing protein [Acidobacteria bacterium]|nr:PD40 domain-containing protein [Acidobacteriota bacterium]